MKGILLAVLLISLNTSAQVFEWARLFVGQSTMTEVKVDQEGSIVAVGEFTNSIDVDPGLGTSTFTSAGSYDGLVVKLDPAGELVWARQLTAPQSVRCYGLTIDSEGNIYAHGTFNGTADFDPGPDVFNLVATGNDNTFLTKFNAAGELIWAFKSLAFIFDITVDSDDNLLFTGTFSNTVDFDPGSMSLNISSEGSSDAYVSKWTNSGTLIWAKTFGGVNPDKGNGIAVDDEGDVYVIGEFFNDAIDFDPGPGVTELISLGATDAFILKLDAMGNLEWVNQIGGLLDQKGRTISVDIFGDVIATGTFNDVVDFDAGPDEVILDGALNQNTFFTKLQAGDGSLIWVKLIESAPQITVTYNVQTDDLGNIYSTGEFANWADFDPSEDTAILESVGSSDGFVYKLDAAGNYEWAKQLDLGRDLHICLDADANLFGCGTSQAGADFNPGPGVFTSNSNGGFIRKLSPCSPSTSSINVFACNSYTVPSGDLTYYASGIYLDTLTNINCCDSIITINLTLNTSTSSTIYESACDTYLSPSGLYNWDTTGIYNDTIPNVAGCDSVITVYLSILTSSSIIDITACESYTSPSGAYTWTTSGQYLDIIPNTFNCDSLITINLTVGYPSESSIDAVACGSYTVPSGNNTYVESGTYFDIIPTQLGCDSLLTIHLVVNNSTSNEIDVQACSSYTLPSGNETVTESGDYFDIIPNVAGCDSLLTIHLEITTFDLTIAQTENQLTVAEANASYVWVNCPDLTPIENQTNQTFSPTEDGEYAVIVTINECSETSECFSYIYQNVAEESQLLTSIYPNPSSGLFFIDLKQPLEDVYITVFDFSGRTIYRNAMARAERIELSLAASAGMYWLSVESKGKRSVTKLMVD